MTGKSRSKQSTLATKSMTGFGRASAENSKLAISVELRSVNNRFLDLSFKLPREYHAYEADLRKLVSARLNRGRLDLLVNRKPLSAECFDLDFNEDLYKTYFSLANSLCEKQGTLTTELKVQLVLKLLEKRDILDTVEKISDDSEEEQLLKSAVSQALDELCAMRQAEGLNLANDVSGRVETLRKIHSQIENLSSTSPAELQKRLTQRLDELADELKLDESRLYTEVVLLADRLDVSEELARLTSHFEQIETALSESPQGRKLDFLQQEIIRELNTIGAKSASAEVKSLIVQAKVEGEKLKEQIQNIE